MNESLRRFYKNPNYIFLLAIIFLLLYGSIFIYSASFSLGSSHAMIIRHFVFVGLGILLFFGAVMIQKDLIHDLAYPIYGFSFLLLLILIVIKFVTKSDEAFRWIQIGNSKLFQPSEFMKIGLILALSKLFSTKKMSDIRMYIMACILTMIPVLLVLLQPDLGTASVILFIFLLMTFFSRLGFKSVFSTILLGSIVAYPLRKFLFKPYQLQRYYTLYNMFLNPRFVDPTGEGWSITQALIAIGSGGLLGKGLLKGTQSKMRFLPDTQYSDFIFAVIGEEFGFFGCLLLIFFYFLLLISSINIIFHSENYFEKMLLIGITGYWFIQIFTNIGMNVSILPVTGIPLPFVSYGGSALLTNFIVAGLVYNAQINRKKLEF